MDVRHRAPTAEAQQSFYAQDDVRFRQRPPRIGWIGGEVCTAPF